MSKVLSLLFLGVCAMYAQPASSAGVFSCGDGYVLVAQTTKVDGLNTMKCEKLWCRDLETESGDKMGAGNTPASGYTGDLDVLYDNENNHITCFGKRKWCSGEVPGEWNPDLGVYTRAGSSTDIYKSYKKGGCFVWRLDKPDCPSGMTAILNGDEWVCAKPSGTSTGRASSLRRTGSVRKQ